MDELQLQYNALLAEVEVLRKENFEMKSLLFEHGLSYVPKSSTQKASIVFLYSPISFSPVNLGAEQRIALFRSLFRGREDVFARRWYNKNTEKGGYQPVCINEWRRGVCDRKKYKCTECPNRNFAPLGYHDIYRHLEGKDEYGSDVIGIYAIMPDNSCSFLCTDFDDKSCQHGYNNDVLAFVGVCKDWGIPYSIERSRSGNGAHVWIFFEEKLPAYKARRLGNAILTEAMNLEDIDFATDEGQIFNGKTFYRAFTKDLTSAKRSIVIASPNLYALQRSSIANILKELTSSGLNILVLTKSDDEQCDYLKSQGLSVRIVPSLSLCCAIIDKQQVWYGSVNIMGYANEEDSVIKLSDSSLANELVNELFREQR